MLVYIRGAGDLASGIALRLHHAGFFIVMSDLPEPTAVRRTVCFSEAVRHGKCMVEDVEAVFASSSIHNTENVTHERKCIKSRETVETIHHILNSGRIAVVIDLDDSILHKLRPDVLVDAIVGKRNLGTAITDAPLVIAVGPGFTAGKDCHALIETKRGHRLGRVILEGTTLPNTGIPGNIAGYGEERVLWSARAGIFHTHKNIGDLVEAGEVVGEIDGHPEKSAISGMIRGLLPDGMKVREHMKLGDVDPRGKEAEYLTVSDKALAVAGGVLEAICRLSDKTDN